MGDDKRLRVKVAGEQFDEIYDEILKETASEDITYAEVFNRAERKLYERAKKLGVDIKQPYSDYESYGRCRSYRLRKRKDVRNKRNQGSSK